VSPEALVYGANRGIVSTLDAHSMFFSPSEYKGLLDATEGEYAGIGVELDLRDDGAEIIAVLEGSPAAEAGLRRGDRITAIDGREVSSSSFDEVHTQIAGPVGTKVTLQILRADRTRVWTFTLIRSWIRVAPLEAKDLGQGTLHVHLKNFPRRVAADLDAMLARHAPKRLVLDLRNNPGGLFDEAVLVCDLFLRDGLIVTASGRQGRQIETHNAHERTPYANLPLAILIDAGSASAAEVVAGALLDRGRARLFGERSYGKGSVQSILDLSDGSGLKLTIARYVTPSGKPIDGRGIEPHENCVPPNEDGDEALEKAKAWLEQR
jgi:carboxyl-terminal processing protease